MRIGLVSHHPRDTATATEVDDDFVRLRWCAAALVRQGLQVDWLTSTDTVDALADHVHLRPAGDDALPPTCRYVLPCQPYDFKGVRLFCVDRTLWQERSLHTRLFTFLCLLQRELPYTALHTWGPISVAYLGVYTARFLGLPAVVSYGRQTLQDGPQETYLWQWVARHATRALVASCIDRERLLAHSDLTLVRVHVVNPALRALGRTMVAQYQSLPCSVGEKPYGPR
jgi:hypothetical protein